MYLFSPSGQDECMSLAYRDRCHNVPARRYRRRNFARRCEINFLPTVHLDTDQSAPKHNHLECRSGLRGFHLCPGTWSLHQSSEAMCDPLTHNSHRCVTTPDTIRTSCRVFEVCDQAVILSGGWNSLSVGVQAQHRAAHMVHLFKRNGIKRRNIKIFHANGIEHIESKQGLKKLLLSAVFLSSICICPKFVWTAKYSQGNHQYKHTLYTSFYPEDVIILSSL